MNNNTLIIINNTNKKNCCYFPIEYRSGNIYSNKTLKIVVCDVAFFFVDNLDVTALKSSHKPRVAGCTRMSENLVQFSGKQENQAQIITLVNNQYQNYQVSFIKLLLFVILFLKHKSTNDTIHRLYCVNVVQIRSDVVPSLALQQHWGRNKRCKVIDSVRLRKKNILTIYFFFSMNHLKTHVICSIINKNIPTNGWLQITSENF